jgi:hypothetical protein
MHRLAAGRPDLSRHLVGHVMSKSQQMLDLAAACQRRAKTPTNLMTSAEFLLAAEALMAQAGEPQSPPDAWRWRYEGCKGWMYTDNEPAFFPDEEKLKPEIQRLCASAHSRPDRESE